jgi:hypothetical protein
MATLVSSEQHDELLKLLRGINEKLAREAESRTESIPASHKAVWKWYEYVVSPDSLSSE